MIGFVRGQVLQKFKSGKSAVSLVVWPYQKDALGVGYTILVSEIQGAQSAVGDVVSLWTYHVQGENDSYLLGFDSSEKMKVFLSLLDVSGVGPKTAMHIVDVLGVQGIGDAIQSNDVKAFAKVPGVGQKTAAKILVELSGKDLDVASVLAPRQLDLTQYSDVIATLQKLGHSSSSARDAVSKASAELALRPELTLAEKVKLVLSK